MGEGIVIKRICCYFIMVNKIETREKEASNLAYIHANRDNPVIQRVIDGETFQKQIRSYFGTYEFCMRIRGIPLYSERVFKKHEKDKDEKLEEILEAINPILENVTIKDEINYKSVRNQLRKEEIKEKIFHAGTLGAIPLAFSGAMLLRVNESLGKIVLSTAGLSFGLNTLWAVYRGLSRDKGENMQMRTYNSFLESLKPVDSLIQNKYPEFVTYEKQLNNIRNCYGTIKEEMEGGNN